MQSDVAVADDFLQALLLVQVVVAGQQRVGRLQVQAGLHLAHAHLGFLAAARARTSSICFWVVLRSASVSSIWSWAARMLR